jgi:hypothetical protein
VRLPMRDIINYAPFYVRAADWAGVPLLFLTEQSHKCVSLSFSNTLTTKRPPTDLTNTILLVSYLDRKMKTITLPKESPDPLQLFRIHHSRRICPAITLAGHAFEAVLAVWIVS